MLMEKKWHYNRIDTFEVSELAKRAGIPTLLARILLSRKIEDLSSVEKYLYPDINYMHDPYLMKDMVEAVKRIILAMRNNEKIVIFGDYDVDGITATSILYIFLTSLNICVDFYIPERLEEGYGITNQAIDQICKKGVDLIVSVDCGISSSEQVRYTRELGVDFVVTDHHECPDRIPADVPCVNPCRQDCMYPFRDLSGAGVALKLVQALCQYLELGNRYIDFLPLAALGTVADVVPLIGENRIIVQKGIEMMANTNNLGLKALMNICNINADTINSYHIGYLMGPRINAVGRLGSANMAVRLFTTNDFDEAMSIAQKMDGENLRRRDIEAQIFDEAMEQVERKNLNRNRIIVVNGEGWHRGVIGIVASRLTEKYYRPSLVLCGEGDVSYGSGRSIIGVDLFSLLGKCCTLLQQFGGHELAAGLTLETTNIDKLNKMINEYALDIDEESFKPKLIIDSIVDPDEINYDSVVELEKLSPFGTANNAPLFIMEQVGIDRAGCVGGGKHLKLQLSAGGRNFDAIGFNLGEVINSLSICKTVHIAFKPEINSWNGIDKVQLNIQDIKPGRLTDDNNTYHYTLEKCIPSTYITKEPTIVQNINDDEISDIVGRHLRNTKRIFIFLNNHSSLYKIKSILDKCEQHIKKDYEICYTGFIGDVAKKINIIINPFINKLDKNIIDTAIIYGKWLDLKYRDSILDWLTGRNVYLCNNGHQGDEDNESLLDRSDLVAVYTYIRKVHHGQGEKINLFAVSQDIEHRYDIDMNYFKVKKSLDIFEELSLLIQKPTGWFERDVALKDGISGKKELESSPLFIRLQQLKEA